MKQRESIFRIVLLPLAVTFAAPAAFSQISFTATGTVQTGARADGTTLADLDGDGIIDLAVATDGAGNQDLIELYRGDGTGIFTPAGLVFLPNSSSPSDIAAADIDGDGDIDLAVVLEDFSQVMVVQNLGAMNFLAAASTPTGGIESRIIEPANLNGDALPDFVVSNRDSNNVSVLINAGGALALSGTTNAGIDPRDVAIGDFTGDGLDDVAVAANDSDTVVILRNTGGGALVQSQILAAAPGASPSGLAAADMDGDGDVDVVAGAGDDDNAFQNFVSIYTNNAGTFGAPLSFASGGLDAGDVLVADFDLDGDADVAVINETSATIATLENLGNATLGAPQMLPFAGGQPDTLEGGDIDGNGSIDLAVNRRQAAGVTIYLNDDSGNPGAIGINYCMANVNSTGATAVMSASGSAAVALNNLTIESSLMPMDTVGYFIVSSAQGFTAGPNGSAGNLCLGGRIGRYSSNVLNSGASGSIAMLLDLGNIPTPAGFVAGAAGQTWNFQCWFRDQILGAPTSNFSDGYAILLD